MPRRPFAADRFAEYQRQSGLDAHSVVGDPLFENAAGHDFRLTPASPALAVEKSPNQVGSRKRLEVD